MHDIAQVSQSLYKNLQAALKKAENAGKVFFFAPDSAPDADPNSEVVTDVDAYADH